MYSNRIFSIVAAVAIFSCLFAPAAFAAKTYTVTFNSGTTPTGTTATVPAGEDFVFAITCQPPTDITTITATGGTLTTNIANAGGPSEPQGTINGLWTVSDIKGDVTITLNLNTQDGADLPTIITDKAEAEAAISSGGGMGGGPGGEMPEGGMPEGGGAPGEGGGMGGTPPSGAPGAAPQS
jgi:hypothetical protein